ncbi:MAG: hypothetical protein EXR51_07530 [Dehalococcoidia bacterium]|nr:hypothetical protein [Dehalococcoidia bacterium]
MIISEVLCNAPAAGRDAAFKWFELENRTGSSVDHQDFGIGDNNRAKPLPPLVVPANGLAVVAASSQAVSSVPVGVPLVVMPDGAIGNGLANSGDRLRLFDATERVLDSLSWGTDRTVNDPPCPAAPTGHSLQRVPGVVSGCRFQDNPSSSPGYRTVLSPPVPNPSGSPVPAPPPTGTAVPAATPASQVVPGIETTLELGPSGGEIGIGGGSGQRRGPGVSSRGVGRQRQHHDATGSQRPGGPGGARRRRVHRQGLRDYGNPGGGIASGRLDKREPH